MDNILVFVVVAVLIAIIVTTQNWVQAAPKELAALAGKSLSPLRPAGVTLIDGQRVDVVTNGEFIEPETEVEVVAGEGSRVVVRSR